MTLMDDACAIRVIPSYWRIHIGQLYDLLFLGVKVVRTSAQARRMFQEMTTLLLKDKKASASTLQMSTRTCCESVLGSPLGLGKRREQ
jgi:hypothetical protein